MPPPTDPPTSAGAARPRDAAATRAAILDAARALFSRHGYEATTVRGVAREAGITQGLVTRYFGSKDGLFRAATAARLDLPGTIAGPRGDFGARLAGSVFARWRRAEPHDPLLILVRSAGSKPEAAVSLGEFLDRESTTPLAAALREYGLEPVDARRRAAAMTALITGAATAHRLAAPTDPSGDPDRAADHPEQWLAAALQALVDH